MRNKLSPLDWAHGEAVRKEGFWVSMFAPARLAASTSNTGLRVAHTALHVVGES